VQFVVCNILGNIKLFAYINEMDKVDHLSKVSRLFEFVCYIKTTQQNTCIFNITV